MGRDGAKLHAMASLGDEFRVAREARGLSLSDVAEQLHIRSTYLQAIEQEDWATIGAAVYVRGFLRTYARFLGVDPEHAIEAFSRSQPAPPPTKQWGASAQPVGVPAPPGRPSIWLWLSGVVAVGLLGYVGYSYYELKTAAPSAPEATSVAAAVPVAAGSASAAPAATVPPTSPPTPAPRWTGTALDVRLTQLSWLRVTVDGRVVFEGELPPGTRRDYTGKHVRLLVGNAGGVEVSAPGEPTRILGSPGQVVERDYTLPGKKAT